MPEDAKWWVPARGWSYTDPNPFVDDGAYGHDWSFFCITDTEDAGWITGREASGLFSARFGRRVEDLQSRIADFLRYETRHGRRVIVSIAGCGDVDARVRRARSTTRPDHVVLRTDPRIVAHSTTLAAWASILADGEFKSTARVRRECPTNAAQPAADTESLNDIERYYLNEPPE